MLWSSLNLLLKLLPVMFYRYGVMGPCDLSLTMASRHIGPHVSKNNLARTLTWTPSIGSWVWPRLPIGFPCLRISFPLPWTPPYCIGCALHIIGFPILFGKFGKKNYEPSS